VSYGNILVRLPNWVGDVVMCTPTLAALRETYPRARITYLLKPYVRKIIEGLGFYDNLLDFEAKGFFGMENLAHSLRLDDYDLALIYPNSFSSAYVAWRAGVPRRVGYATDLRRWLLTDALPFEREGKKRKPVPMVYYYDRIASHVGAELRNPKPVLVPSEEGRQRCYEFFSSRGIGEDEPLAGVSPGAKFGSTKLWLAERFAEVVTRLRDELDMRSVIFCGPGEEEICNAIAEKCEAAKPVNTADRIIALDDAKAFVERLSLMVTTDAGLRHYAVAFDVPVVVVMGPTDRRYTDANLERTTIIQKTEIDCVPCHLKKCPKGNLCMRQISADEVFEAAGELLAHFGRKS
jgi:heptosyltransferase-2